MAFALGLKAIRRLCEVQSALDWHRSKLSTTLFNGAEADVFQWVDQHVRLHGALPQIQTLEQQWPEIKQLETPEPSSYYVRMLENRYFYDVLNTASTATLQALKVDQDAYAQGVEAFQKAINAITQQKYRTKIMDVGLEAGQLVLSEYHHLLNEENDVARFGWPYLDASGPLLAGDVVSFVGRPARGKTWLSLYCALTNWRTVKPFSSAVGSRNVMFVSMEMALLPIAQRIIAMYAGTNYSQLKTGSYATSPKDKNPYDKFKASLKLLINEDAKLYVVDGNLAASIEDIYILADQLKCRIVVIDGAYLCKHKNPRLNRYERVAENAEAIKMNTNLLGCVTFSSWQFSRDAIKKNKKEKDVGLEDIGYSDVIGQVSSVVLGLFEDEGVETMIARVVRLLKGRSGEVGLFKINWDFLTMNFNQRQEEQEQQALGYV